MLKAIAGGSSGGSTTPLVGQTLTLTPAANQTAITVSGATDTLSSPLLDLSQTWNAGAVTFTAAKINITDTASAAASLLLDLQLAGSSKFKVTKSGQLQVPVTNGSYSVNAGGTAVVYGRTGDNLTVFSNSVNAAEFTSATLQLLSTYSLAWSSGAIGAANDVVLVRDAANTLALRNGATAQTLRVYGSFTDASNGDWLNITKAAGGVATIATSANGTGTASTISFTPAVAFVAGITTLGGAQFLTTSTALTDSAAAQVATMTNGPVAGNPTKWIAINDNGTLRKIPAW